MINDERVVRSISDLLPLVPKAQLQGSAGQDSRKARNGEMESSFLRLPAHWRWTVAGGLWVNLNDAVEIATQQADRG